MIDARSSRGGRSWRQLDLGVGVRSSPVVFFVPVETKSQKENFWFLLNRNFEKGSTLKSIKIEAKEEPAQKMDVFAVIVESFTLFQCAESSSGDSTN